MWEKVKKELEVAKCCDHCETILGETPHIHNILENQTSILTKKKEKKKENIKSLQENN